MSEQQKHFPEFYVTAPQPCPYLSGRLERKLFTHLTHDKPPALVDNLLKGGFRRSQNIAYMPYCEGCQACVSVRVLVDEFAPTRSMRRVLEANGYVWDDDRKELRSPAGVAVQFVLSGERAGSGSELSLPDPSVEGTVVDVEDLPALSLARLIESKIACGQGNMRRTHKDFADVVELIAIHGLSLSPANVPRSMPLVRRAAMTAAKTRSGATRNARARVANVEGSP